MNGPADWMETQQQLWRTWQSLMGMSGANAGGSPFGADGISEFWRQCGIDPLAAANPIAMFSRLFTPMGGAAGDNASPENFRNWMSQALEGFLQNAGASAGGVDPTEFMSMFMRSPLTGWAGFAQPGNDPFGASAWSGMKPSEFAGLFDLPPLGLTREWETRWRELQSAAKGEFEARQGLARQGGRIYFAALKKFARTIRDNDPSDGDITSLRGLYDLWVDIAEAAYRERVMTTDYSEAFAQFVNESARCRKAWQALVNDWQEAMNLPNRRELDSMIERQADLAQRLRNLEQPQTEFDVDALVERVRMLDSEVNRLNERIESVERVPETPKAPTARKPKRKAARAASAGKLPAPRVGPAKTKPPRSKKRAKTKSKPNATRPAGADEFDIGNLGTGS